MESVTKDTEVSTKELAIVLGLSVRRVQQLIQDGVIDAKSRGRFVLADAVQRYIATRDKVFSSKEEKQLEIIRQTSEVTLRKAKSDIAKMEADELRGKLHRADDVKAMTADLVYTLRNYLIALPGRVAVDLASASTAAECAEILKKETHLMMNEMTRYRYDPKKYAERVRERRSWEAGADDDDD